MKIDRWLTAGHAAIEYSRPIRSSCAVSSAPLEPVRTYFYPAYGRSNAHLPRPLASFDCNAPRFSHVISKTLNFVLSLYTTYIQLVTFLAGNSSLCLPINSFTRLRMSFKRPPGSYTWKRREVDKIGLGVTPL